MVRAPGKSARNVACSLTCAPRQRRSTGRRRRPRTRAHCRRNRRTKPYWSRWCPGTRRSALRRSDADNGSAMPACRAAARARAADLGEIDHPGAVAAFLVQRVAAGITSAQASSPGCSVGGRRPSSFCALNHQAICRGGAGLVQFQLLGHALDQGSAVVAVQDLETLRSFASCQCSAAAGGRGMERADPRPRLPLRNCASARARISPAALLVNVTRRCRARHAVHLVEPGDAWVSTRVLPLPAPARTR